MFGPKILEIVDSPTSGNLEVRQLGKDVYVTTSGLTQSGGLMKELWQNTFKKIGSKVLKHKRWLILGLATGTVARLISQKYFPTHIVGVEIDLTMLGIGQKYFNLDTIPGLQIVTQDANDYILNATYRFDWILVDLFVGERPPNFVYSSKFIQAVQKKGQRAIYNHLFYDEGKRQKARLLSAKLAAVYPHTRLIRELTNLLIICG